MMAKQTSIEEILGRKVVMVVPMQAATPQMTIARPKEVEPPKPAKKEDESLYASSEGFRTYPKAVIERQRKVLKELAEKPEKFGVSKARVKVVGKLNDIHEHPEKYGNKTEQQRAIAICLGKLMGRTGNINEVEEDN